MDRRTIWAILLMMVIAIAPALFLPGPPAPGGPAGPTPDSGRATPSDRTPPAPTLRPADTLGAPAAGPAPTRDDTVRVTSPLYTYGFSTTGARLVEATLPEYRSMVPADRRRPVQIAPDSSDMLGLTLVVGGDTLPLDRWTFTPSTDSLGVGGPATLRFQGSQGGIAVDLTYAFRPDDYRVDVAGRVSGIGPNGGLLLVGLGPTIPNTEADSNENYRSLALVTMQEETERTDFSDLEPGESVTLSGPFAWAAIKSKYFVTAALAVDSTGGRISGVTATALPGAADQSTGARVRLSLPLPPSGTFGYTLYAGPMEYDRLARIGHDFDDVNPYGWPGFRTVIRIFAVPVRWLLVAMHEHLNLAYGVVLIVFGILVRIILWPLNQKAMRANMQLQAIQPHMKEIQERYRNDPPRMQQEMFKLYREYNVNPFGGCWPMLLPMPVLLALFFVFQNSIELRGTSFLWLPDLSRPDPLYIIPLIMGLSMYVLTKVGQLGMEPNPQAKMMLYVMPAMMTVFFLWFPSGLNLYYAVSNIASIPQQYLIARERQRRTARAIVNVKTEPQAEPRKSGGGRTGKAKRR